MNNNSNDNNVNNQWDRGDKISFAFSVLAFIVSIISIVVTVFTNTARFEVFEDLKYEQLKMVANLKSIETKAIFAQSTSKKQSTSKEFNYSQEMSNIDLLRTNPSHLIFLSSISEWEERKRLEENLILLSNNIKTKNSSVILSTTRNALRVMADDRNRNKIKNKDLNKIMSSLCELIIYDKSATNKPNWKPEMKSQRVLKQASLVPLFGQSINNEESLKDNELKNDESENSNSISQKQQDSSNYAIREAPFEAFLWYLIYQKQVDDPDVYLFYGVLVNNDSLVNIAFANGGNINVTVDEIIERYKTEYEEYNATPYSHERILKDNGETGNENKQDGEGFGMNTLEFIKHNLLFILCVTMVITFMVTAFNVIKISWKLKRENQRLNNYVDEKEEEASVAKVEETTQQNEEAINSAAEKDQVEVEEYKKSNEEAMVNNKEIPHPNIEECDAIGTSAILARAIKQMKEKKEEENEAKTIELPTDPLNGILYHLEQAKNLAEDAKENKTKQNNQHGKTSSISA